MKKYGLVVIAVMVLPCLVLAGGPSQKAIDSISPDEAKRIVSYLSSDDLKGRPTPSPELDRAADYIAENLKTYGLLPVNGSYFQLLHIHRTYLGDTNVVKVVGRDGVAKELAIKKDFMPFEMTADQRVQGQVVFVGYGISAPDKLYDDYRDVDVKGKIVLALKGAPKENDANSPFHNKKDASYGRVSDKVRTAIDHGAIGFMLVTNPATSGLLKPTGFPWPSLHKGFPADAVPVSVVRKEQTKVPTIQVGEEAIRQWFGDVDSLRTIARQIDSLLTPHSFALTHGQVSIRTSTRVVEQLSRNVTAMWPGTDTKLKEQWVIVGGHYDHVGIRQNTPAGQDSINNGADDNASGTAGVMLVARAFAADKKKPKRSVLFLAFAGEEKGLWGSEVYVDQPLVPLEKTVAMINLDMIGRNRVDSLTIFGKTVSPDLWAMAQKENKHFKIKLSAGELGSSGGSDHMPFNKKKIPTLFYHTGLHPDYHRPSDQIEKINFGKMAMVSRLCFRSAWKLANSDFQPAFVETKIK